MNLFKKPKYLLMILLASLTFVTFVPQFTRAQPGTPLGLPGAVLNKAITDKVAPAIGMASEATGNWLADKLGLIVWFFTIKLPSIILLQEIKIFAMVGPYNGFTTQDQVVSAWGTVRDLANMFFILILLLMSFGTILQVQGYGYRQMLSKLLLMAILVNFSKSIVAILIDFSQIVTLSFLAPVLSSLAGNIVVAMGLQNIMSLRDNYQDNNAANPDDKYTSVSYLMAMILGGIMMIITTVIMGVILIMFVMRIVGLWIMVILSPLAFLARAFPKMASYYSQWENELSKNLTAGPALAFFMWLAFSIVGQGNISQSFEDGTATARDVERYADGSFSTVVSKAAEQSNMLNFIIAISLLMAGLKMAASSGVAGASMAGKASGNLQKWGSRLGRGATIGAAAGVGALAWRGTSGEGGVKGIVGQGRGALGQSMAVGGQALHIGALQRGGLSLQAQENSRRQRKQAKFDKRFEGMSEEDQKAYNESLAKGVGFLGKREAKANLAKSELDGKASIDPGRATKMLEELQQAGDYKAVEKLRSRSMAVNTAGSLEKVIADKGLDAVARMNMKGMTPEQAKVLLGQDPKALSGMMDKMEVSQRTDFMKALDTHIKAGKIDYGKKAGIGDETSDLYKARLLQGKYDSDNADLHSDFTSGRITDSDRDKFAQTLQKSSKAEDLVKIDGSSDLFKHVAVATAAADPSKANEMYGKAKTEEQREVLVNSHVSVGNISNVINNPAIDKNLINESKIIEHFDAKITAAMGGGVSRFDASSQLAKRTPNLAHLAFYDSTTKAVNYANFARYAKSLRFDELLKIETEELKKLISIKGLTPEQIKLLADKQGIT